jgi:hypothetical protein
MYCPRLCPTSLQRPLQKCTGIYQVLKINQQHPSYDSFLGIGIRLHAIWICLRRGFDLLSMTLSPPISKSQKTHVLTRYFQTPCDSWQHDPARCVSLIQQRMVEVECLVCRCPSRIQRPVLVESSFRMARSMSAGNANDRTPESNTAVGGVAVEHMKSGRHCSILAITSCSA